MGKIDQEANKLRFASITQSGGNLVVPSSVRRDFQPPPNADYLPSRKFVGYINDLAGLGWSFNEPSSGFLAYQDVVTPTLMAQWRQTHQPVGLNIVEVMPKEPDTTMLDLPIGALGYAATALTYADSLRRGGINISNLRIIVPSRVSELVNGATVEKQEADAQVFHNLVTLYIDNYLPTLNLATETTSPLAITLDHGHTPDPDTLTELVGRAQELRSRFPDVHQRLMEKAERHSKGGHDNGIDPELKPALYLLSHPEAWRRSQEGKFFVPDARPAINFLCGSEIGLAFDWWTIRELWEQAETDVATVVSAKQMLPPYNFKSHAEPKIRDLLDKTPAQLVDPLRVAGNGRWEITEIVDNILQIRTNIDQSPRSRQFAGVPARAIPIAELIRHAA